MFRRLRWHWAKMDMAFRSVSPPPRYIKVRYRRHRTTEGFYPNADPYEQLATLYNDYGRWLVPPYGPFLAAAGRYYGQPIRSVLDLACGTGLISRQAAKRTELVVGLDISEAMLREARSRTSANNVRYVRADFRDFCLTENFDAAICGTDALNYLERSEELVGVFSCIGRHLRPGGLFAFDSFDGRFFRHVAGKKAVVEVNSEGFEWYNFYDPGSRVSETRVVVQGVVERHRRIPIEEKDVRHAASEAGLEIAAHFSAKSFRFLQALLPLLCFHPVRQFYLLRRS